MQLVTMVQTFMYVRSSRSLCGPVKDDGLLLYSPVLQYMLAASNLVAQPRSKSVWTPESHAL
jgi:hypothetical protein